MTDYDWVENMSGAALTEEELAQSAARDTQDGSNLGYLAAVYLNARQEFLDHLEELGYEFG